MSKKSSSCTDEKIGKFAMEHYTYINQIFGDLSLREIIAELYPNEKYDFLAVESGEDFEGSYHHVLKDKKTGKQKCSVDDGFQNLEENENDTLCQSYSLLSYFGTKISKDHKDRQMDMIEMYRNLLSKKKFINALDDIIYSGNKNYWHDYSNKGKYIKMNKDEIIHKIREVLTDWKKFGYWYFTGDGRCPTK